MDLATRPAPAPPAAPAAAVIPEPRPTSRPLWIAVYTATAGLLIARSASMQELVRQQFLSSGHAGQLDDPHLETLAVRTGTFLAVLLALFVLLLYYSLAAAFERHLYPVARRLRGETTFGVFFAVAALSTLPVHAAALALGQMSPRGIPAYHAYVLVAGAVAPLLFRSHWQDLPRHKVVLLFAASVGLAILSVGI